jgi:alginate O-acetyltransferase complex protein AlgJ
MIEPLANSTTRSRTTSRPMAIVTVLLFLLCTALPSISPWLTPDELISTTEQRYLATWPRLDATRASLESWPDRFEEWYDDRVGFRDWMIRSWARLSIGVFGVSPSDQLIVGESGWFFYGDRHDVEHYRGLDPLSSQELETWTRVLEDRRDWLAERGIAYLLVLAPDKNLVYPEYMPARLPRHSDVHPLDQLSRHLAATSDLDVVDLLPVLVAAKQKERVYHLTDTHWNDRGAYEAYLAIHARLERMLPELANVEPVQVTRGQHAERGMGLAHLVGLTDVYPEIVLDASIIAPRAIIKPEHAPTYDTRVRTLQPIAHGVPGDSLPRAVMFRDSFANALVPYLAEDFSRILYVWDRDVDPRVVSVEKPDVVIHEIVGRFLGRRPRDIEEVRDRERQRR